MTLLKWLQTTTQANSEIADALGVSRSMVSALRLRKRRPSIETLRRCLVLIPDFDAAGTIREFADVDRTPSRSDADLEADDAP